VPGLKRPAKRAFDEQLLDQIAEDSEPNRVLDQVPNHGSLDAVPIFGAKLVPVLPASERAFGLGVCEMVIPLEIGDSSRPLGAEEKTRDHSKRRVNLGADSRYSGRDCGAGSFRRWHKSQSVDACCGLRWHDARQVVGIREEQENAAEWEGSPSLELDAVDHAAKF